MTAADDSFELFDLRIEIEEIRGICTCGHNVGDAFELQGGKLSLPAGEAFCIYALQSTLPLLPAKQRPLQANDWMTTDMRVICPDPLCGVVMRIARTGRRVLRHADTSAVPLGSSVPEPPAPATSDLESRRDNTHNPD
jgi:uncharacterized repeat protein (TIGR04076 family)